ncbi:transcription initiation factor TFIID subunit 10 isoform X2 [Citrus clementina]|uniref:transcription initiation factor TFIID subunit 10 isoform X2 n=1 Tax=Citrus clementina TaxID=85681 RepID=UPI000CED1E9A|nr:transcription initiation factor TFIID subunit 10 isoform X2 [Citrus x clementina]
MNHNNNFQQSSDGRHDDDAALTEFLSSLMGYTPTIPDELVEHYLAKSGFQCPDVRLIRLVAVATQKFVAEVATDALQAALSYVRLVGDMFDLGCCPKMKLKDENPFKNLALFSSALACFSLGLVKIWPV